MVICHGTHRRKKKNFKNKIINGKKGLITNMKSKVLCLLLLGSFLLTSCSNKTKSLDITSTEIAEEQNQDYHQIEEMAGSDNQDTYHYLVYCEDTEITLYFGIDLSKLDIQQVDLYRSSELCYEDISVEDIYDNVINVKMKKYIPSFNHIVIHDSEGETMTFYTGEFYLEKSSSTSPKTEQIVKDMYEITDENSVKFICTLLKKYRKDYDVQVQCPKLASSYFTKKQTQNKTSTVVTFELKEEYKDSPEIAVDFQVLVTNKATGKSFVDMIPYIPFHSEDMDEM